MLMMLQQILTVNELIPQFTPINGQVLDVTNYLGWLRVKTAFPKAVVASTDIITAGLSLRVQLAGHLNIALHSPYLLVCWFVTLCVPTYHMHNNSIVAGRALEWVGMFEGQVGFLDMKYQVCFPLTWHCVYLIGVNTFNR